MPETCTILIPSMPHLKFALLMLLLQALESPRIAPDMTASIEGVVVRAGTTEPLGNVTVTLGGRSGEKALVTGSDGKFAFQELEPGPYFLTASSPGLIRDELSPLNLRASDNLKDILLGMQQTGSISGKILDANGDPLVRAVVQAQRFSYHTGVPTLLTLQAVLTNDLGEYRLFWLPAGSYVISATASDPRAAAVPILISHNSSFYGMTRNLLLRGGTGGNTGVPVASRLTETGARIEEASLPIYFPGTPDENVAARVELRAGAHQDGIDIPVVPVRAYRVRGRVVSGLTAVPIADAAVSIIPRHADRRAEPLPISVPAAGSFEISGIRPGSYFLVAQAHGNGIDTSGRMTGLATIDVGNADVDNVTIVARPAYNVAGRVLIEGQAAESGTGGRAAQVVLRAGGQFGEPFETTATVAKDGSFTLTTGLQGDFQVFLRNHAEIGYVRSIRLGASDGLTGNIGLDGPPQVPLEIVISPRAGTLRGTVLNQQRRPVFGARVVLIPEGMARSRPDLYISGTTEAGGTFLLNGIAPGVYKVFAWEHVEANAWLDAEFLRTVENLGRPLNLVEGSKETLELDAIPWR